MLNVRYATAAIALLTLSAAACSQPSQDKAAPTSGAPVTGLTAEAVRGATVAKSPGLISVEATSRNQGVNIFQGPVLVTFAVEGEGARVRVRQGRDWIERPAGESNSVMLGRGGASVIQVTSSSGQRIDVRVLSVTDCETATCAPLPLTSTAPSP